MTSRPTRLRIAGFKSFAEPVNLDILPGLTGIVGPNGCGKSNVVEALRWAMGETSARSLRGGEMDDVIFAGTTARASRNLAEVSITLESAGTPLPAPFEAEAELQVTRRIERGAGSVFRANGRELRARDVQTLFADLASGARSSGMVSQGRVADLVRARPEERRQVLEEAAGITGLHARRHEAELKLRAAEHNMARAADAASQLDGTRESLRRQARQATRYRAISGLIHAAEAEHLAIMHARAETALDEAQHAFQRAEAALETALEKEKAAEAAASTADRALPALRTTASDARSAWEKCRFEAEALSARAERAAREVEATQARVAELTADLEAAASLELDATGALQRLEAAIAAHTESLATLPGRIEEANREATRMRAAWLAAESMADKAGRDANTAVAAAEQAEAALHAAEDRRAAARHQHDALLAELAPCETRRIGQASLAQAATATRAAEAALLAARADLEAAEAARAAATDELLPARTDSEREATRRLAGSTEAARAQSGVERAALAWRETEAARERHRSGLIEARAVLAANEAADSAAAKLAEAEAALDRTEQDATSAVSAAASAKRRAEDALAAQARARDELSAARSRAGRLATDLQVSENALVAAGDGPDEASRRQAAARCQQAAQDLAVLNDAWALAKEAHDTAGRAWDSARHAVSGAEADAARLRAEIEGLEAAMQGGDDGAPDLLGTLDVPAGLERAFGAAFGEAARAAIDRPDMPDQCAWRVLPPMPAASLPTGSVALASLVAAPQALARLLSHVALLDDTTAGAAVQPDLPAGMLAVDRAGGSWRWDGLVIPAGAPNPAASRLALRRRLNAARAGLDAASSNAVLARQTLADAARQAEASEAQAAMAALARHAAEAAWAEARQAIDRQVQDADHAEARKSALEPSIAALRTECRIADQAADRAEETCALLPDPAALQQDARSAAAQAETAALALAAARKTRADARARMEAAQQTAQTLAGQAERAGALCEAADAAHARAAAEMQEAAAILSTAEAVLAGLPDPAILTGAVEAATAEEARCRAAEADARRLGRQAEAELDRIRQAEAQLGLCHGEAEAQHSGLLDRVRRSQADLDEAGQASQQARDASAALPEPGALLALAANARGTLAAARLHARQCEAAAPALEAEQAERLRARDELQAEYRAWIRRLEEARSRHAALAARQQAAHAAHRLAASRPGEAAAQTIQAAEALNGAEQHHARADATLEEADRHARLLATTLRDASEQARALHDRKLLLHAARDAAEAARAAVRARAIERLGGDAKLPHAADRSDLAEERARRKHERLCRERDEVGPVNLRAELELDELDQRIATLARECGELEQAAAKLRHAISHLNREGRERLLAVFTQVDAHFRTLFTRMMGGGQAHLAMTGADDPLAAGLEIFAEPPGKRLSALSLLSGGEQALTALSLIFAVFRCTPAPLCVLDEVDAPLDDANVERFCTLLDDVVRDTGTSFLVVTHHQLTMARMDRLFGVTMQERGVSRLLSVDLHHAVHLTAEDRPMLHAAE